MSKKLVQFDSSSFFQLPSLPRIQNTLILVQTIKSFQQNKSFTSLSGNNEVHSGQEQYEVSLQVQLPPREQHKSVTTSTRRKKAGCTCKKTNCLKMYCECFASGKVCIPQCACYGCFNHSGNQQAVEKIKQTAKPKKITKGQGCNCKKTQCQKKYCQCFNAGLKCGDQCKCIGCGNHQGQNDNCQGLSQLLN